MHSAVRACALHEQSCKINQIRGAPWQLYQAKKLTIYFATTTNVSVVLWELLLNIQTICLEKIPLLSLLFIENSSGTVEGSDGKQITPQLLNKAFLAKSTHCKCEVNIHKLAHIASFPEAAR